MITTNRASLVLAAGDVDEFAALWPVIMPNTPLPGTRAEVRIVMHHARTQAESVPMPARLYSHAWLKERNLPSGLPDKHAPVPRIVEAVGVAVMTQNPDLAPAAKMIEKAMAAAIEDCYANGDTEPELVQSRIEAARKKATKQLFGG